MASRKDLELAKLLLTHRILDDEEVRRAFEQQAARLHAGRNEPLADVLYELQLVPRGGLATLEGPGPEVTQPFPGYRVTGLLGEGGMSTVYRAVYLANKTPVAIKVLKPIQALRGDYRRRFEDEARLLLELEHHAIVAGYERGTSAGHAWFSMDLVEGVTVQEVIERRGFLTPPEALSITWQVAQALAYLHARGLLHRDMKPGNVMVEASGRARLIDLGLVGRMGGAAAEASNVTVGTVEYLSPEQARGRADLDPRSDIYSLGVSLYHMVVGEVPFQGETDYEVMAKQIMASLDTQKVKNRRIPPEVHFFIAKMTSKERESRYARLEDVVRDVAGYLPGGAVPLELGVPQVVMPVGARAPSPPTARPLSPPVARPMTPPVARPVSPPVARPVAPPVAKPVAPPVAKPVAPPVAKPVAPPVAKPVAPPVARPVAPPVARPVVLPVAKPVAAPVAPATPSAPAPALAPSTTPTPPPAPPPAPAKKQFVAPIPKHKRKPEDR
jgi:serine/threonine-protein kinase